MTTRIVLAYSGGIRGSAAIGWLREQHQAEVITLTVDVGQERDLEEIRERALALGAVRAHVLERREAFAAAALAAFGPAAAGVNAGLDVVIASLAPPVIAEALGEVAAIEHAVMVAHAADVGVDALDLAIARHCPLPIVRAASGGSSTAGDAAQQVRASGVPLPAPARRWSESRHLLCRPVADTPAPAAGSSVDVTFAAGVPVAVSGVAFPPGELLECLSLLGGRQGVGRLAGRQRTVDAPAAVLLRAASAVLDQPNGVVRLTLHDGSCTAAALEHTSSHLVNHL